MGKLKNLFKRMEMDLNRSLSSEVLLYNDAVSIVHDATKLCWDKPAENNYQAKKDFIRRRIATGHESILEHSNIIMLLTISQDYIDDILSCNYHYLHTAIKHIDGVYYLLIGGSIRGYKHIFKKQVDQNNVVCKLIANQLYTLCPREFFVDLIEDGVLKDNFTDVMTMNENLDIDISTTDFDEKHPVESTNPMIEITNIDNFSAIADTLKAKYGFEYEEILPMFTVSIQFKHMSRVITQQLVRHRNGTTQASGRYIDLGNAVFNSPEKFKSKYNGVKYDINIAGTNYTLTLQQIGDILLPIYDSLRKQGVDKEDARAFLPLNTQCGDVYMTFTYESLLHFLKLRTHQSAQAEIRIYAQIIYDSLIDRLCNALHTDRNHIYDYLEPVYKIKYTTEPETMTEEVIGEPVEEILEEDTNHGNE